MEQHPESAGVLGGRLGDTSSSQLSAFVSKNKMKSLKEERRECGHEKVLVTRAEVKKYSGERRLSLPVFIREAGMICHLLGS